MSAETAPRKRFLRLPEVLDKTGMGRTYIYEKMAVGEFPKVVKLGEKTSVWLESEIDAWMDAKAAKREAA